MLPQDGIIMADLKRSLTSKQAWRLFEEAVRNIDSLEEAAEWLSKNPAIARKMTGTGLLACFDEDIKSRK